MIPRNGYGHNKENGRAHRSNGRVARASAWRNGYGERGFATPGFSRSQGRFNVGKIVTTSGENDANVGQFRKGDNLRGKRRDKGVKPRDPNMGVVATPIEESSMRTKLKGRQELAQDQNPWQWNMNKVESESKSGDGTNVEALKRRLEMPTFKGWNLKGWIFRAKRFFVAHGM